MSNNRLTRSIAAATALLAMTGGTFTTAAGATLEEVVVTARKREESLQEIPVAASVFSAAALEMRSATDVADLTASAPSVSYQDRAGGHQTSISIRGIASDVRNIGIDDSVGVYVDGVYIGRPMFYNVDLAEVAQVELLRGPQGTLFGKNTIAGALNITTKAVPEQFEGKLTFSAGADGLRYGKGYFGGMFADNIGGSLSVVNKQTDGFMSNSTSGDKLQAVDQQGVAGKLQFSGDNYQLVVSADHSEKDNAVNASQIIIPGGSGLGQSFGDEEGGIFGQQYAPFTVEEDGPQGYEEEVTGFAANLTVQLASDYELNVIAASRSMDLYATFDDDNTSADLLASFFTDEADQLSLEARITSPANDTFEWIAGAYYYNQEVDSNRQTAAVGGDLNVFGAGSVEATSTALYFSGDYHLSERVDLNLGLRFTQDEKEALWNQFGNGLAAFGLPEVEHVGDETWEEFSSTLALTYALSDDATVYVKYAEGFKGGGFMTDLVGLDGFALEPETVESYEVGLKSTLLDSTLRLNIAAYRMDYTDLQTLDLAGLQFIGANAGEAEITGLEVDFEWLATEALMLSGGFGFNDAEYSSFIQTVNGTATDLSGNTAKNAPETTAALLAEYTIQIDNGMQVTLVGEWNYKDEIHYDVDNDDNTLAPAYSLLNARVVLASASESWKVAAWAKNIADEEYFSYLRDGPFGQQTGLYGEPRTFGFDVTFNF